MPERIAQLLGDSLVQAIDAFFDAWTRMNVALLEGNTAAATEAVADCRAALGTWLALLVERLDSRNASMLLDLHKRVDSEETRIQNLEGLLGEDHGHDDMGRP
jgi:hypothetical protein